MEDRNLTLELETAANKVRLIERLLFDCYDTLVPDYEASQRKESLMMYAGIEFLVNIADELESINKGFIEEESCGVDILAKNKVGVQRGRAIKEREVSYGAVG